MLSLICIFLPFIIRSFFTLYTLTLILIILGFCFKVQGRSVQPRQLTATFPSTGQAKSPNYILWIYIRTSRLCVRYQSNFLNENFNIRLVGLDYRANFNIVSYNCFFFLLSKFWAGFNPCQVLVVVSDQHLNVAETWVPLRFCLLVL